MPRVARELRRIALVFRQIAALGALILGVRILWLSAAAGIAHAQSKETEATQSARETNVDGDNVSSKALSGGVRNPHRPDLEELRDLVGKAHPDEKIEAPPEVPVQRRILVDVGPARSDVFVAKKSVGKTPYGGQIACTAGEEVRIQILPPRGVPLERRVTCRGDTLLVQE